MLSLAEQLIFERYKRPEYAGSVIDANLIANGANQSCGDEVRLSARLAGETIEDLKHLTRACAVCSASADLLAEYMAGKSLIELPTEDTVVEWLDIPLSPIRRKCAVLPLQTLKRDLDSRRNRSAVDAG